MDIVVIPDPQVRDGVNIEHIGLAGDYIRKHKPTHVVVLGDWWDFPSLCRFKNPREQENLRVLSDMEAGIEALDLFVSRIKRGRNKPEMYFCIGNHDPQVRIERLYDMMPQLEGVIDVPNLKDWGFRVYNFLEVLTLGGIRFSHFFQNVHAAKRGPLGGMIDTMIKNAGFSFVQGHQQGLKIGKHYLADGTERIGVMAGSFYSHNEKFMGEQGNNHWRGIVHLRDVKDGGADIQEIHLKNLANYC